MLEIQVPRASEFHLPEITRDDIVRSVTEFHAPHVDLTRLELPRVDLPEAISSRAWPRVDMPHVDVAKAAAGIAAAVGLRRRARRPRWPFAALGLLAAGAAAAALITNDGFRSRLTDRARAVRLRFGTMRANHLELTRMDREHPVAFPAAETAPIEASPLADGPWTDATRYPTGLGSNNGGNADQQPELHPV